MCCCFDLLENKIDIVTRHNRGNSKGRRDAERYIRLVVAIIDACRDKKPPSWELEGSMRVAIIDTIPGQTAALQSP